jgi:signal peptidase I
MRIVLTTSPELISTDRSLLPSARKLRTPMTALLRQGCQCLFVAALTAASYYVVTNFFIRSVKVVGRSMVPTLADSQDYLLNRWIYHVHPPQYSDIVVLRDPSDGGYSVKRIIARPGDAIYLRDGEVYLNGSKLIEPYLSRGTLTFTDSDKREELIMCGKDQFFVLGDNRHNSIDSRSYGPVSRSSILGPIL